MKGLEVLLYLLLAGLLGRMLLPGLLPFLCGGAVAVMLRPAALSLYRKLHLRYKAAAGLACLLFYALMGLILWSLGFLLYAQTISFFTRLPQKIAEYSQPSRPVWERLISHFHLSLPGEEEAVRNFSDTVSASIGQALSELSAEVLKKAADVAAHLPSLLTAVAVGILSSFFLLMDYDAIAAFLLRQTSGKLGKIICESKEFLLHTGKRVIRAYLLLMLLTFTEVSLGLWLLRVEYFLLIGLLTALVDILPVLGSGSVLVPWGLWNLAAGSPTLGAGLLLLYAAVTVVRMAAEPKILGDKIGLPPIAALMSMYLGIRLAGLVGLLLFPIAATLLVYLSRSGTLPFFRFHS